MAKVNWINGSIEPPEPGAYLNDDQAHDCPPVQTGGLPLAGTGRPGPHCPKNIYGEWKYRPPRVI